MGWTSTNWQSVDGVLDNFPYSTYLTVSIVDTISESNIKYCWDTSGEYTVFRRTPILDTINGTNLKFWITLNSFEIMGMPKPTENKQILTIPGAFRGCSNLTSVTIPKSVKYIDYFAFWDTGLTSAKIAQDCIYQDSSFPTECIINYYS